MRRRASAHAALGACALAGLGTTAAAAEPPWWTNAPRARATAGGIPELAERARATVVHVRATSTTGVAAESAQVSVGTGFIVSADGIIVTNEHVVRGANEVRVRLWGGHELAACVVGADAPADLALLKVEAGKPLPVLPLGDSSEVRVGDPVVAIGNPYGFDHSLTTGVISAKDRVVSMTGAPSRLPPGPRDPYALFIQTDAAINVGSSGGPLIDARGAAVGVNTAFWGNERRPAQGISFAIPVNIAKALITRLRSTGNAARSLLGVDAQTFDTELAMAFRTKVSRGALVASVLPGGPAADGGIEPGDIIVAWGGEPVGDSETLRIVAQLATPDSRVRVRLVRDNKVIEKQVVVRRAPEAAPQPLHPATCERAPAVGAMRDGFELVDVPAARSIALPGGKGAAVGRVDAGGPAAEAGLVRDDVILRVGQARVGTSADVRAALAASSVGQPVPLLVRRQGFDFWIALPHRGPP